MSNLTLANRLWPQAASSNLVRNIVLAIVGSLFVAAAAQITVPMWPVPMTLQTLAVLAVGAAYGSRLGAATLGLYALEGAVGLPFFAGAKSGIFDSKLSYLLPAGSMGYIVGFIIAAWLVGKLVEQGWGASLLKTTLATLIGAVVLYVPGLAWLASWAAITGVVPEGQTAVGVAMTWGLTPFIPGDAIKAVLAGLAVGATGLMVAKRVE
jgi:biotin transport system substrate-specific component